MLPPPDYAQPRLSRTLFASEEAASPQIIDDTVVQCAEVAWKYVDPNTGVAETSRMFSADVLALACMANACRCCVHLYGIGETDALPTSACDPLESSKPPKAFVPIVKSDVSSASTQATSSSHQQSRMLPRPMRPIGYALELYSLGSLHTALVRVRPAFDRRRIVSIVLGVTSFLRDLHAQGVQHQNLKPTNVLLECSCRAGRERMWRTYNSVGDAERAPAPRVLDIRRQRCQCMSDPSAPLSAAVSDTGHRKPMPLDFGANSASDEYTRLTLAYQAPEHIKVDYSVSGVSLAPARRRKISGPLAAMDMYSLGTLLWELLAYRSIGAHMPILDAIYVQSSRKQKDGLPPGLVMSLLDAERPAPPAVEGLEDLAGLCGRLMALDPHARPTAAEAEAELRLLWDKELLAMGDDERARWAVMRVNKSQSKVAPPPAGQPTVSLDDVSASLAMVDRTFCDSAKNINKPAITQLQLEMQRNAT